MNIYLIFGLGVIIGSIVSNIIFWHRTEKGVLRIDRSDPGKEIWRIDLENLLTENTKRFILRIDRDANLHDSQE